MPEARYRMPEVRGRRFGERGRPGRGRRRRADGTGWNGPPARPAGLPARRRSAGFSACRIAGFQPAGGRLQGQSAKRLTGCRLALLTSGVRGLTARDTADCQSALRGRSFGVSEFQCGAAVPAAGVRARRPHRLQARGLHPLQVSAAARRKGVSSVLAVVGLTDLPTSQPAGLKVSNVANPPHFPPRRLGSRRYGRLETCATTSTISGSAPSGPDQ